MTNLGTLFLAKYSWQWIQGTGVRSGEYARVAKPVSVSPTLALRYFAAILLLWAFGFSPTFAATTFMPMLPKGTYIVATKEVTKVIYPDHAKYVGNYAQLNRATAMHAPFIVVTGEIAQQIIAALNERPTTTGSMVSTVLAGITTLALYHVYGWFNETYSNIESVCEVDLDEIYFTEKGDKYVCEEKFRKFPE